MAAASTEAPVGTEQRYAYDDYTLPRPWIRVFDERSGYWYYRNLENGVVQYEKPVAQPSYVENVRPSIQQNVVTQTVSTSSLETSGYVVFISCGPDIEKKIASIVIETLRSVCKVKVFDKEELQVGDSIQEAKLNAIQTASLHVVILSSGYMEFSCLGERLEDLSYMIPTTGHKYVAEEIVPKKLIQKIKELLTGKVERKVKGKYVTEGKSKENNVARIFPVFYEEVDRYELKQVNKGKYAKAFSQLKAEYSSEKIEEFKSALHHVSGLHPLIVGPNHYTEGAVLKEIIKTAENLKLKSYRGDGIEGDYKDCRKPEVEKCK